MGRFNFGEVKEGEKVVTCPVTGRRHRVTRWVDRGEGRITALESELVDGGEPEEVAAE